MERIKVLREKFYLLLQKSKGLSSKALTLLKNQPDYALILSWHYGKNIIKNLRKRGYKGKFIIPLPNPRIEN